MSKITVMPVTVTLESPDIEVAARPATNKTTVMPVAVTIDGDEQTIDAGPAT